MVVRGLLAPAVMAVLALTAGPALAQSPVSGSAQPGQAAPIRVLASAVVGQSSPGRDQEKLTYVVSADIDGHSILSLWNSSARWFHLDYAAPGRLGGKNLPTIISGKKWFPKWPSPGENRFCQCYSSTFSHVMPPIPNDVTHFSFTAVSCRDSCSGNYTDGLLVIDFNDDPSAGDAEYTVKIVFTVNGVLPGPTRV
jgi:hypothetical protein